MKSMLSTLFICVITMSSTLAQKSDTVSIQLLGGQLEGTMTIADTTKLTTVAYIIPGSGSNDRNGNSENMIINELLMLSDSLISKGVSTLRVDKRMSGNSFFENVTEEEVTFDDFVADARLWVDFLEEQKRFSEIIILGHSQGSLVAILAAQDNDKVDAVVNLAGAGRPIDEGIREQVYNRLPIAQKQLDPILDKLVKGERVDTVPIYFNQIVRPSVQPFLISYMKYNPMEEIAKLNIPVAIVQGTTDFQVTMEDAEKLHTAYPKAELIIIEGMNHVFKEAPMDRAENMKTYLDLEIPIIDGLIDPLVEFIRSVSK